MQKIPSKPGLPPFPDIDNPHDPENSKRLRAWQNEPELIQAFYERDGHEPAGTERRWDENHPFLFRNVAEQFTSMQTSHGHSIPLPEKPSDIQYYQRLMQSMIKLARVAFRCGTKRELRALWSWDHGVTGENGETELLSRGLLHQDKLNLVGEHYFYQDFLRKHHNAWVPAHLNAFLELHLVHSLYEGPVLCDLMFLRSLVQACGGRESKPFDQLVFVPSKKGKPDPSGSRIQTPHLGQAMDFLEGALNKLPRRKGLLRRDKERILNLIKDQRKPDFKIKNLRDAVGHAKYEVGQAGVTFDIYEHLFLSHFDDFRRYKNESGRTSREHSPHPYRYRSVNRENTESMIRHAVAIHICVWAAFEEFRMQWIWNEASGGKRFTNQLANPNRHVISWARKQLNPLRVPVSEKRAAVLAHKQEQKRLREKVSVSSTN